MDKFMFCVRLYKMCEQIPSRIHWHSALLVLTVLSVTVDSQGDQLIQYQLKEEVPESTLVGTIGESLLSIPSSTFQDVEYQFLSETAPNRRYFSLDSSTGELRTVGRIDRDTICAFQDTCDLSLDITVQGEGLFQIVKVIVELIDINDNIPSFPEERHVLYVSETTEADTPFTLPNAEDADAGHYGIKTYELSPFQDKFGIRETEDGSVQMTVKKKLDREQQEFYSLELRAKDGDGQIAVMTVEVTVLDTNDNSPTFEKEEYEVYVNEDLPISSTVLEVRANDPDGGANGEITYEFSRKTDALYSHLFELNAFNGVITTLQKLDYAENSEYVLSLVAKDQGPSSLAGYTKVIIKVRDLNDHAPQISFNALSVRNTAVVAEHMGRGAFVAHVSVTDPDGGDNGQFTCQLDDPSFELSQIYPTEYKILTTRDFDREARDEYSVNLSCEDLGSPAQSSRAGLVVEVSDTNDHPPIFTQPVYAVEVMENNAIHRELVQVNATDVDIGENGQVTFSISGRGFYNSQVQINPKTGLITAAEVLDHEERAEWEFQIIATDMGSPTPLSATATFFLTVLDANDEPPKFPQPSFTFGVPENQPPGSVVGEVVAFDADSAPFNIITYSLDQIGRQYFKIDPNDGTMTTLQQLDREHRASYSFTVIASNDHDGLKSRAQVQVLVQDANDNAPVIEFPNGDTVSTSANLDLGDQVTRIIAHDDDTAKNSQMRYSIMASSHPDIFTLNPMSGSLTVKKDLYNYREQTVSMTVKVTDRGTPEQWSINKLYVYVNGTGALPKASPLLNDTSFIVIILLSVTAVVSIILIITIILLIKRRRNKAGNRGPSYRCHVETHDATEKDTEQGADHRTSTPKKKSRNENELYPAINSVDGQLRANGQVDSLSSCQTQNRNNHDKACNSKNPSRKVHFHGNNSNNEPDKRGCPQKQSRPNCLQQPLNPAGFAAAMQRPDYKEETRHRLLYGSGDVPHQSAGRGTATNMRQISNEHQLQPRQEGNPDHDSDRGSCDSGKGASDPEEGNNTSSDSIPPPPPRDSRANRGGRDVGLRAQNGSHNLRSRPSVDLPPAVVPRNDAPCAKPPQYSQSHDHLPNSGATKPSIGLPQPHSASFNNGNSRDCLGRDNNVPPLPKRTGSSKPPCKVHGNTAHNKPLPIPQPCTDHNVMEHFPALCNYGSPGGTLESRGGYSEGGSTTSGEYILNTGLVQKPEISKDVFV